ncbi:competence protein CoiA family protein [Rossellomorea sp. SC111]|uniref:competence protein CoiA n=1 Tax=Rossellomorea sp. SC111 TaxID=2968985 RepID=UPI00215AA6BB|nr:competence protein CoiA family protein [Rossellomorea sp. SC111]MCR8849059.1 competence protein CoiA family protein [Rossellomorea sp. SC111]
MLTALLNQQVITTIHYSREELRRLRREGVSFVCPHCSSILTMRIGSRNTPHFAHISHSDCELVRGETPQHLLSKQLLYGRVSSLYESVSLEHYIKEIKQVADIFVKTDTADIAIEIQCSTIPISEVVRRSNGYHREGITPFWILTQSLKSKKLLNLTTFQQAFIRYSPSLDYFLLQFLPDRGIFHLYTRLLPVSSTAFMSAAPIIIPVAEFTLPPVIPNVPILPPYSLSKWNDFRTKWIYNKIHYNKARTDVFLREVYGEGDTFLYLPLFIGLPVIPHGIHIRNHEVEWQYYLWKDCLKKDSLFSLESVSNALNRRLTKGHIEFRSFPLQKSDKVIKKIAGGYLSVLEEVHVLRKINDTFQLTEPWSCPDHFSAFEQHKHDFFPKWKHILKKL